MDAMMFKFPDGTRARIQALALGGESMTAVLLRAINCLDQSIPVNTGQSIPVNTGQSIPVNTDIDELESRLIARIEAIEARLQMTAVLDAPAPVESAPAQIDSIPVVIESAPLAVESIPVDLDAPVESAPAMDLTAEVPIDLNAEIIALVKLALESGEKNFNSRIARQLNCSEGKVRLARKAANI